MYILRSVCGFVLLTILYISSLVLAFAGLKVGISDTTIIAGQPVIVYADVSGSRGIIDYDRYIDGTPLEGVSTHGLDLTREVYVELFPEDEDTDTVRLVTLEATDAFGTSSDTATLSIVHDSLGICGDGYIDVSLGEECDDGNIQSGDGCNDTCWCEGVCVDILMSSL